MIRVFITYTVYINTILFLKYAVAENNVNSVSSTASPEVLLFERFKENYNRVYPNRESEQRGFEHFLNNLAKMNELNKAHKTNVVAYQLNRYADLDPEAINERFGIAITPYDNMEQENKVAIKREHRHKFLEEMNLYELNDVDKLYKSWAKKWGKPDELKKKKPNMIKYYRFIKTVAEANKQKFAGNDVSIGQNADVVLEPNKFFYGK